MNELREKLERVRAGAWTKGSPFIRPEAQECLRYRRFDDEGSCLSDLAGAALRQVIDEQYPDRVAAFRDLWDSCVIVGFNDDPRTTQADVERVLEKAAIRLDEVVG